MSNVVSSLNHPTAGMALFSYRRVNTVNSAPRMNDAVKTLWTQGYYNIRSEMTSPVEIHKASLNAFPSEHLWNEVDTILHKIWDEVDFVSVQEDDATFEAARLADIKRYKDLYGDISSWD